MAVHMHEQGLQEERTVWVIEEDFEDMYSYKVVIIVE